MRNMNPPWIIWAFAALWLGAMCEASSLDVAEEAGSNSTSKDRMQREVTERERRLIPYMTFYVAQSFRNPTSGERQNVLIPIQAQPTSVERISGVAQVQTNNIPNAVGQKRFESPQVTQAGAGRYTEEGFYPTPSIELMPKDLYKNQPAAPQVFGQVYRFKSPGPQVQQNRVQHLVRPGQQQPQQQLRQRMNQKYPEPQLINLIPENVNYDSPRYVVTSPRPQHTYTSAKLQTLIGNPYLARDATYYKGAQRTIADNLYVPGKVYAVNIVPKPGPIAIHRLAPRPEKANVNQIFLGPTIQTPYGAKVKFELEDARIPNLVGNVQIERDPTPLTYVPEQISSNYIHEQPPIAEPPRKEEQGVYYTHDISQERPGQVSFVPIHPPTLPSRPIQVETTAKHPSTPSPPVDQIQIVTTAQPHAANDVTPDTFREDNPGKLNPDKLPVDNSVVNLLTILKDTNQLPQNFTPENIDKSIKTLALILQRLQNEKKYQTFSASPKVPRPPKPESTHAEHEKQNKFHNYPQQSGTSTPGRPGIDYPTYATIPQTQFDCAAQRYKGFFGDPDTNCQVWHYCDLNGGQASFLCPNGTIFSQVALTCDWWFNVKCASTSQLYVLNERLYKYILPFSPSFPEDYSGPLVDRYLAAKFKEMEAKSRLKALKALISTAKPEPSTSTTNAADISITTPDYKTET